VRITFQRSGNQRQDFNLLAAVHELLISYEGGDRFIFVLRNGPNGDQLLEFPNDTTRYCGELGMKLADLVGPKAIQIQEGA
jgi:hypothetical protein